MAMVYFQYVFCVSVTDAGEVVSVGFTANSVCNNSCETGLSSFHAPVTEISDSLLMCGTNGSLTI